MSRNWWHNVADGRSRRRKAAVRNTRWRRLAIERLEDRTLLKGKKITTIEGLPENHPVKQAWIKEHVPQCGYCQPGVIMQVAALMSRDKKSDAASIVAAMDDVICRCGAYPRIKRCIQAALEIAKKEGKRA